MYFLTTWILLSDRGDTFKYGDNFAGLGIKKTITFFIYHHGFVKYLHRYQHPDKEERGYTENKPSAIQCNKILVLS